MGLVVLERLRSRSSSTVDPSSDYKRLSCACTLKLTHRALQFRILQAKNDTLLSKPVALCIVHAAFGLCARQLCSKQRKLGLVDALKLTEWTSVALAILKLRAVSCDDTSGVSVIDLFRGLRDMHVTDEFLAHGGTELAPMSTTTDLMVALKYSASEHPFIFKLRSGNVANRGADLSYLSAFPEEKELLYPPLTYLKPTGRKQVVSNCTFVEVEPTLA